MATCATSWVIAAALAASVRLGFFLGGGGGRGEGRGEPPLAPVETRIAAALALAAVICLGGGATPPPVLVSLARHAGFAAFLQAAADPRPGADDADRACVRLALAAAGSAACVLPPAAQAFFFLQAPHAPPFGAQTGGGLPWAGMRAAETFYVAARLAAPFLLAGGTGTAEPGGLLAAVLLILWGGLNVVWLGPNLDAMAKEA